MNIFENITSGYKKAAAGIAIVSFLAIMYLALLPGGTILAKAEVVSALSGTPIVGALVKLVDYPQYNATTDGNGNYIMSDVPEGTYLISASAPGYASNTSTVTVLEGITVSKDFTLSPLYKTYIPWTATQGSWTTPFVIANKGLLNASVNISYYNSADGSNVGNYSMNIQPGASNFVFRQWTTNTDGSAVVVSDQPVSVMVDQFGGSLFAAYEVDPSSSTEVFLPWTATTNGWVTPFVIENLGEVKATVNITYYNVDGSEAGNYSSEIDPSASKFVFRGWSAGGDGAAKINSNQPIAVLVNMFGPTQFGAYTPPSEASNQIAIPWTATTGGWTTPFRVANRGTSSTVVDISYYNQANGLVAGTDSVTLAPNEVANIFRENSTANGTDGSAVLTSTQNISVIVQQYTTSGLYEVYTPASTSSKTIMIPWTATKGGWTTPYVIVNKGTANASIDIKYYNSADGSYVGNYSVNNLPPGASKFVFREWTAPGTDGSAVLVSDQPITAMVDQFAGSIFGAYTPIG